MADAMFNAQFLFWHETVNLNTLEYARPLKRVSESQTIPTPAIAIPHTSDTSLYPIRLSFFLLYYVQSSFRAVSEHFKSTFRALSEFHSSFRAVSEFWSTFRALSEHFQSTLRALSEQFQSSFRAVF